MVSRYTFPRRNNHHFLWSAVLVLSLLPVQRCTTLHITGWEEFREHTKLYGEMGYWSGLESGHSTGSTSMEGVPRIICDSHSVSTSLTSPAQDNPANQPASTTLRMFVAPATEKCSLAYAFAVVALLSGIMNLVITTVYQEYIETLQQPLVTERWLEVRTCTLLYSKAYDLCHHTGRPHIMCTSSLKQLSFGFSSHSQQSGSSGGLHLWFCMFLTDKHICSLIGTSTLSIIFSTWVGLAMGSSTDFSCPSRHVYLLRGTITTIALTALMSILVMIWTLQSFAVRNRG